MVNYEYGKKIINNAELDNTLKNDLLKYLQQYKDIRPKYKKHIAEDYKNLITAIKTNDTLRNIKFFFNAFRAEVVNAKSEMDKIDKKQQEEFYTDFMPKNVENKEWLDKQLVYQLHHSVGPEIDKPHYVANSPNYMHQADLLYLPNDKGYLYLLCVVDIYNSFFDCEKMRGKYSYDALEAIKKIYNRSLKHRYLEMPKIISVDAGKEFKGEFKSFFEDQGVHVRAITAGRHLGIIDNKIKILGSALLRRMTAEEMKTKKPTHKWIDYYAKIVDLMNEDSKNNPNAIHQSHLLINKKIPMVRNDGKNLVIPIGTKVRVRLFKPKTFEGKAMTGGIRASDLKYENKIKRITNILLKPDSPILYVIDNDVDNPLTRNSFILADENNELPP